MSTFIQKSSAFAILFLTKDYEDLINERVGEGGIISFNPKVDDIADKISTDIGGIKLIALGRVREANSGCFCAENSLLKAFISHMVLEDSQEVIIDMSAGIEHLSRGVAEGIDLMLRVRIIKVNINFKINLINLDTEI